MRAHLFISFDSVKPRIQIFVAAALFDEHSGPEETAFQVLSAVSAALCTALQRAIELVNDDRTTLSRSYLRADPGLRYPQVALNIPTDIQY